ncbi:TPA: hypothetical protein DEW47_01885 [Patescibacteria group bacterium]|nr:MAG: hypothetical protein UT71_C0002G0070 [Parcubacteria group bacterium GW2011_GWF2_40_10]KKR47845.1 MAG: hypothetical protein UT83_C0003G0058 [Parcubacteria group bacterium GW2011_GWA2_40_143]KKR60278.1 MAG: hypothetical protein UT97_C0003G0060 [Parcubacteria group bacterium GW2011_GWC2_40_31]KKR77431.1 MAG: hypothetical protein UU20_C0007G0001 [Parcubacteria group bacterium GW2011_GWE2_40_8]HBB56469.1 hypothetical protein [Patescibacteria group bacterium]
MDQNNEDNKGIDLSHALDDSSSRVKFKGEQQYVRPYYSDTPKIIQLVMKYSGGYIKDEKQASYVLLGVVAVAIVIAIIFLFSGGGSKAKLEAPPGQKIIYPENAPPRLQERF